MLRAKSFVAVAALLLSASVALALEEKVLEKLHCPVSGKDVSADHTAKHQDGTVYFCCPKCPVAFKANPEKFVAKANMQLVASDQYKQQACPFTGGKLNETTAIKVGDAKVAFCCEKCQGKAKAMEGDKAIEAVFSEKAFEKGKFVKAEEEKK